MQEDADDTFIIKSFHAWEPDNYDRYHSCSSTVNISPGERKYFLLMSEQLTAIMHRKYKINDIIHKSELSNHIKTNIDGCIDTLNNPQQYPEANIQAVQHTQTLYETMLKRVDELIGYLLKHDCIIRYQYPNSLREWITSIVSFVVNC